MIKYIDLCCGIGGFRIGINLFQNNNKKYKFKCVLSADIKQDAIDTYNINFKENNKIKDINNIIIKEIPKFNLLCAGFPCQPFSSAGNKKGFKDKRGGLIFKIVDICNYHKPQNILLENVSNLITLKKGEYILKITELFKNIGYNVYYKKINSKFFGCPQSRDRVYIICSLNNIKISNLILNNTIIKLKDVIDYTDKSNNINNIFSKKIINLHKKKSLYGCKINDKRGGIKNIHSWSLGLNGNINNDEEKLLNNIMLQRRKKHWAKKKILNGWMECR